MDVVDRMKLGLNVVIKNKPYLAALFSAITGKDCSTENTFDSVHKEDILPFVSTCLPIMDDTSDQEHFRLILDVIRNATHGKTIFLICGPSSSGKDTLASLVKEELYFKDNVSEYSYCKKYTTRDRRGNEGLDEYSRKLEPSGNYVYCKSLDEMRSYNIDLEYELYGCYYALSKNDLFCTEYPKKHLACIYGKLENISNVKKVIFSKYNRIPFTILIKAPKRELKYRINGRHSLSKSEKSDRIIEMDRQSNFIELKGEVFEANFDLVIDNGNNQNLAFGASKMTEFVYNLIQWADKALM